MRLKRIGTRMLIGILPVVAVAMAALTIISAISGKNIITEQMQARMVSDLATQEAIISNQISLIDKTVTGLADNTSVSYRKSNMRTFQSAISQTISEDETLQEVGLWFEPYCIDANTEFLSPKVSKKNGATVIGMGGTEYTTSPFYTRALNADSTFFMDPTYDEETDTMILRAVCPMRNDVWVKIGCATIDLDMATLIESINNVKIGKTGGAFMVSDTGAYLAGVSHDKIKAGENFTSDKGMSKIAADILTREEGQATYSADGETYHLYYKTIPDVNWKIIIRVPDSELNAPVLSLVQILIIVALIALIFAVGAILFQVHNIARGIRKVNHFANVLADGDFTGDPLKTKRIDELGQMGAALNTMFDRNKGVLWDISEHASTINSSSENLFAATEELLLQFENIEKLMTNVNEQMMSASAATEEVNASAQEVTSSVNVLAGETDESRVMTEEIKKRAAEVENSSRESHDYALNLSAKYEKELAESIANAKIVESIGTLAEVISGIAKQINLLSLNASIEAARAGEAGRGFAVVATEIGKLAGETAEAVGQIQSTVESVKGAFKSLTESSGSLLSFLQNTVTPDYDKFVDVAKQYGSDAKRIEESSSRISNMAENIENIMLEVAHAVQNIAESTENTADSSNQIMTTVSQVSEVVGQVSEMSREQERIAQRLHDVVGNFKLKASEEEAELTVEEAIREVNEEAEAEGLAE